MNLISIPADAVLLNCSVCKQVMITKPSLDRLKSRVRHYVKSGELVAFDGDRIKGRPLCPTCTEPRPLAGRPGTLEPSPWRENAVRAMEDGS